MSIIKKQQKKNNNDDNIIYRLEKVDTTKHLCYNNQPKEGD